MPYIKSKDGFRIYYNYINSKHEKTPIVFVHGWLVNWTCFKEEIKIFKKLGYPVIYLDLRGHGKSDKPNDLKYYSIDSMQDDLDRILIKEHVKQINLVGHSMGGFVSLLYCIKHQSNVRRMVIIDSTYKNPLYFSKIIYFNKHKKFAKILTSFLAKHTKVKDIALKGAKEVDFSKMKSFSDSRIFYNSIINTPIHSGSALLRSMFNFNAEKDLRKIRKPVLIISSDEDELFPVRLEKKFSAKIIGSKLLVVKGTHSIIIKNPREIAKIIQGFIEPENRGLISRKHV